MVLTAAIDAIFRAEGGRVLAGLIRRFGSFDLAEDALQDAFAKALQVWPRDGLPDQPAAWLATVAQRRAIDALRRQKTGPQLMDELPEAAVEIVEEPPHPADTTGIADDRLRLLFICCHPALARNAQVALALRTLCGLTTAEIARAFVEPEATTAQRLVRVKRKIAEARIPYELPLREALPERLAIVLDVVYLVFNEGYATTDQRTLLRADLCSEAIRLARLLNDLLPGEAEAEGLLALMLLHDSRRDTRVSAAGELVPLDEQDRSRWNVERIAEGRGWLDQALARRRPGPRQLQAAIAALHASAASAEATDWKQIVALYAALHQQQPTAIVELNAAVALAMAEGLSLGLGWLDALAARGDLAGYHLLPAARADLLRRSGRLVEAAEAYRDALVLVRNPAERAYLLRRLAEVAQASAQTSYGKPT
jgi:RNA polymerase sigma-70 factor, ECF subfamily